jgi:hypothetical protein
MNDTLLGYTNVAFAGLGFYIMFKFAFLGLGTVGKALLYLSHIGSMNQAARAQFHHYNNHPDGFNTMVINNHTLYLRHGMANERLRLALRFLFPVMPFHANDKDVLRWQQKALDTMSVFSAMAVLLCLYSNDQYSYLAWGAVCLITGTIVNIYVRHIFYKRKRAALHRYLNSLYKDSQDNTLDALRHLLEGVPLPIQAEKVLTVALPYLIYSLDPDRLSSRAIAQSIGHIISVDTLKNA